MVEGCTGNSILKISPVLPSIEIMSPSEIRIDFIVANFSFSLTSISSAPHTAVFPIPRATTAACEVFPPRLVNIPMAAIIPDKSSGLVSRRNKITGSPRSAHSIAVSESKTAFPTAAPGEAAIPLVIADGASRLSNCGNIN